MKRKIRNNVFETNSSSIHTLVIAHDIDKNSVTPTEIHFNLGEFGWEYNNLSDMNSKASYLWTYICVELAFYDTKHRWDEKDLMYAEAQANVEKYMQVLRDILEPYGFTCEFEDPEYTSSCRKSYYIDHSSEWATSEYNKDENGKYHWKKIDGGPFENMLYDKDMLFDYLFSNNSNIATGNDNDDNDGESVQPIYPENCSYDEYYKGN